jgi:hypothetical protein
VAKWLILDQFNTLLNDTNTDHLHSIERHTHMLESDVHVARTILTAGCMTAINHGGLKQTSACKLATSRDRAINKKILNAMKFMHERILLLFSKYRRFVISAIF